MNDAFYIAATGMQAQQLNVDTIANNLANVNTAGFKKSRVSFVDMVQRGTAAAPSEGGLSASSGLLRLGAGVGIANVARLFSKGDLRQTDAPLDVAIDGEGFMQAEGVDGTPVFIRGGSLKTGPDGRLMTQDGLPLHQNIVIPAGASDISIGADGRVQYSLAGQSGRIDAGQIELVRFADQGGLAVIGDNLYRASAATGEPQLVRAGEDGVGSIRQRSLEGSNVSMVDEMVGLMIAQRAYESSVKVVQAADEIAGLVNNLRK